MNTAASQLSRGVHGSEYVIHVIVLEPNVDTRLSLPQEVAEE